jgi:DNA-binding CsgD family transcriptional regulator
MARILAGDLPKAAEHAQRAMALAKDLDRPDLLGEALAVDGSLAFLMGEGLPEDVMERAETLETWDQARPTPVHPSVAYGLLLKWSDDLDGARKRLHRALQQASDSGNERSLPFLLYHLAELESWAGNWSLAEEHAVRADELAVQTGQDSSRAFTLYARGLVEALRGDTEAARAHSLEGLELAERSGATPVAILHTANLGFLELSLSDPGRANRYLGPLAGAALEARIDEPGVVRYLGDAAEAMIGVGDVEQAAGLVQALEEAAERVGRTSALVSSARARALLAAALTEMPEAISAAERSVERAESAGQPFELARSLLVLGILLRRDRRKKDARDALERALELFGGLGAKLWSERVTDELGRIGGRAPSALELTPTEERVAAAVAEGMTNQEAARALFMSSKTVEWNLSRIYRKLGVRSRTELARWLQDRTGSA